jgi:predicted dehydrogenase
MVGLGAVAETHVGVLEDVPFVNGEDRQVYLSVREAGGSADVPDIIVIATPTPSHAAVCGEIARYFPEARLLVEKPAAVNLSEARHILAEIGGRQPVDVAYHMSFSPEVIWGQQAVQESRAGELMSAELFFADPYYDDFEHAQATLCSSWVDSGINALSVLSRFATIAERTTLRPMGTDRQSIFEARLTCKTGSLEADALLVTSWYVADAAKTTRLRYASGVELLMDHTGVAAYLLHDGKVETFFGADRSIPRRERHYRALYQSWLAEGKRTLPTETSLQLHEILLG